LDPDSNREVERAPGIGKLMLITVYRQACCSQDDQAGPLEAEYRVEANSTFASFIQQIIESGFLQFSSSHDRMTGEVDGKVFVEVFSPCGSNARKPEFSINPHLPIHALLGSKPFAFRFREISKVWRVSAV
jgi:hypothetical protein